MHQLFYSKNFWKNLVNTLILVAYYKEIWDQIIWKMYDCKSEFLVYLIKVAVKFIKISEKISLDIRTSLNLKNVDDFLKDFFMDSLF